MTTTILNAKEIETNVNKLCTEILKINDEDTLYFLGIRTRGVTIMNRMCAILEKEYKKTCKTGTLDINLYRDDMNIRESLPVIKGTNIEFDINDKPLFLIDDVLFTGRTIRSALDEIIDFGRPRYIKLVTLIDRGYRELPIQSDINAINVETSYSDRVKVLLEENDNKNCVELIKNE